MISFQIVEKKQLEENLKPGETFILTVAFVYKGFGLALVVGELDA